VGILLHVNDIRDAQPTSNTAINSYITLKAYFKELYTLANV